MSAWIKCPIRKGCGHCDKGHSEWNTWSFFQDQIYCINLLDRDDRYQSSQEEFHRVGLCRYVTYYRTVKPSGIDVPKGMSQGTYGCWLSHIAVNTKAANSGAPYALIFEDDVKFLSFTSKDIQQMIHSLSTRKMRRSNWDFFHLGYIALRAHYFEGHHLFRIKSLMAEAYISSEHGRSLLLRGFKKLVHHTRAIDEWMYQYGFQLGWFPCLCTQHTSLPTSIGYGSCMSFCCELRAGNARSINFVLMFAFPLLVCFLLAWLIFYIYLAFVRI